MDIPVIHVSSQKPSTSPENSLSSMSPVRNRQHPPKTPCLYPHCWNTSNKDIYRKLSGNLPLDNVWHEGWPSPLSLWLGILNILQITPFLTSYSWPTFNKDIKTKFSGYLPQDQTKLYMTSSMTLSSTSLIKNPQCPLRTPIVLLNPHFWHTFKKSYQYETFKVSSLRSN